MSSCVTPTSTQRPGPISPIMLAVDAYTAPRSPVARAPASQRGGQPPDDALGLFVLLQRPAGVRWRPTRRRQPSRTSFTVFSRSFRRSYTIVLRSPAEITRSNGGVDPVELPAHLPVLVVELLSSLPSTVFAIRLARSRSRRVLAERAALFIFARCREGLPAASRRSGRPSTPAARRPGSARPYEKRAPTGAGPCLFIASRFAVASSSHWPPDRNTMPGTAAGHDSPEARGSGVGDSSAYACRRARCPGCTMFGFSSMPSTRTAARTARRRRREQRRGRDLGRSARSCGRRP